MSAEHTSNQAPLMTIDDLAVSFDLREGGRTRVVDGVSLSVHRGQTLAVVGESGCGKSVTALSVLRLLPAHAAHYERGRILLRSDGGVLDVLALDERALRRVRGGVAAMIFQEPMTSLNPVMTIGDQIVEAVLLHRGVKGDEAWEIAVRALEDVGIAGAKKRLGAFPHEFSGGMRQRVMIAMALACRPAVLLADEPTTALDVTIQAQILDLLGSLRDERGMGVMLITHAMGVVAEQADVVCVMYNGRVVEYASVFDLFDRPLHPYTRGLLRSIPRFGARRERLVTVRDVVDDRSEFEHLGGEKGGLVPWWPANAPPAGVPSGSGGGAGVCRLVEVEPGRWVNLWTTERVAALPARPPDLAFTRPSRSLSR